MKLAGAGAAPHDRDGDRRVGEYGHPLRAKAEQRRNGSAGPANHHRLVFCAA